MVVKQTWTIAGTGRAIHNTPDRAHNRPTILPGTVIGTTSPYPTVVIVTIAHQNEAKSTLEGIFLKICK